MRKLIIILLVTLTAILTMLGGGVTSKTWTGFGLNLIPFWLIWAVMFSPIFFVKENLHKNLVIRK